MSDAPDDVLNVSPRVITEIALGVQPPLDVLQRYGYDHDTAARLLANPVFERRIREEKEHLEASDDIDRVFNRMCYRLVRDKLVSVAVSGSMPPADLVKATDMLRKHAGLGDTVADAQTPRAVINLSFRSGRTPVVVMQTEPDVFDALSPPRHLVGRSERSTLNAELALPADYEDG